MYKRNKNISYFLGPILTPTYLHVNGESGYVVLYEKLFGKLFEK